MTYALWTIALLILSLLAAGIVLGRDDGAWRGETVFSWDFPIDVALSFASLPAFAIQRLGAILGQWSRQWQDRRLRVPQPTTPVAGFSGDRYEVRFEPTSPQTRTVRFDGIQNVGLAFGDAAVRVELSPEPRTPEGP